MKSILLASASAFCVCGTYAAEITVATANNPDMVLMEKLGANLCRRTPTSPSNPLCCRTPRSGRT